MIYLDTIITPEELCREIVNAWNGEDYFFWYDGVRYSEDDVHNFEEHLKQLDK